MAKRYWLMKTDPETFAFQDLLRAPKGKSCWDGVRNYQARNYLREAQVGDGVLVYHSQPDKAVMGTATVVKGAHPDPTQFDKKHDGYDAGSDPDDPRWVAIDVAPGGAFGRPVDLDTMRKTKSLAGLELLRRGSRLSVHPVTEAQWNAILALGRG